MLSILVAQSMRDSNTCVATGNALDATHSGKTKITSGFAAATKKTTRTSGMPMPFLGSRERYFDV